MKICPVCNQTYADDSLNFCLIDGVGLRQITDTPQSKTPSNSKFRKRLILGFIGLILLTGTISIIWLTFLYLKTGISGSFENISDKSNTDSKANRRKSHEKELLLNLKMYKEIETGMNLKEVNQIIGNEGEELFSAGNPGKYQMSSVRWGTPFTYIMVTFQDDKVLMKTQNGLE